MPFHIYITFSYCLPKLHPALHPPVQQVCWNTWNSTFYTSFILVFTPVKQKSWFHIYIYIHCCVIHTYPENPIQRNGHEWQSWVCVISSELIEKLTGSDMKRSGPVRQRECISRVHWSVESDSRLITAMAFVSEGQGKCRSDHRLSNSWISSDQRRRLHTFEPSFADYTILR